MIRRDFLKLTGLAAVAAGTGFTAGKILNNKKSVSYTLHGFLPADEQVIRKTVAVFNQKVKSNTNPVVIADGSLARFIQNSDRLSKHKSYSNSGKIIYRVKKLSSFVNADILVSDEQTNIYSPENDFTISLSDLRNELQNRKAEYIFTAEYKDESFFSSLFRSDEKEVVIENKNGIADRISLDKNFKNIKVKGLRGKTEFSIQNRIVKVHSSQCRHEICKHTFASSNGDIIACAPNKVLLRIENV